MTFYAVWTLIAALVAGTIAVTLLIASPRSREWFQWLVEHFPKLAWFFLRQARKIVVLVVGLTCILVGVAMMVLPGPAMVVIPLGLAILATEFVWARRLLRRLQNEAGSWWRYLTESAGPPPEHEEEDEIEIEIPPKDDQK